MKYFLALLLASVVSVHAEPTDRPKLQVPFSEAEPSLDLGHEDPAWRHAVVIDGLGLPLGTTAAQTPAATKVSLLWTKTHLWIKFHCEAAAITRLPGVTAGAPPARDLPYYKADCAEMFIDAVGDGREFVELQVSPDNGVFDGLHLYTTNVESEANFLIKQDLIDREGWFFLEWNFPGLRTATNIHLDAPSKGWDAVLALPAKDLLRRLGKTEYASGMGLRANFLRFDYSTRPGPAAVVTNWAPVPFGRAHRAPAGMGYLTLADAIAGSSD